MKTYDSGCGVYKDINGKFYRLEDGKVFHKSCYQLLKKQNNGMDMSFTDLCGIFTGNHDLIVGQLVEWQNYIDKDFEYYLRGSHVHVTQSHKTKYGS